MSSNIQNIHSLQNTKDLKYLTDEYMHQSLANMGQRLGVKGDGIAYTSFSFSDIVNLDGTKYSSDNYIGYLKYELAPSGNLYSNIGVADKKDRNNFFTLDIDKNIFNNYYISSPLTFEIPVNNIDTYKETSLLSISKGYFNQVLFGKLMGTDAIDQNNVEIQVNKFNTDTNDIEFAIRAYHLYNDGHSNYYAMLILEKNTNNNIDLDDKYDYSLKGYLFNSNLIESDDLRKYFESSFKYDELISNDNPFYIIPNIDINDFTLESLLKYNGITDCTIFGLIKNYKINQDLYGLDKDCFLRLNYNTEKDEYLSINSSDRYDDIINKYVDIFDKDNIGILNRVIFLNKDIIYTYPNLLEYYSNSQYNSSKQVMFRRTLISLYEKLNDQGRGILYIPLDYKFNYFCNNNNILQLYYSDILYVTLLDLKLRRNDEVEDEFNTGNVLYDYTGIDKIIGYRFNFEYNKKYKEYITSINIDSIYTLPYINAGRNWSLNDKDTLISAIGKDAGNPNLILIYNYAEGLGKDKKIKHKILSGANKDIIEGSKWIEKKFRINPNTGVITNNILNANKEVYGSCMIPEISKTNYNAFTDSLIISICTLDCVSNIENGSAINIVSSLWSLSSKIINDDKYVQFDYIKAPMNNTELEYALDISMLLNFEKIVENTVNNIGSSASPEFSLLLLKTLTNIPYQESIDNSDKIWLVMQNQTAEKYVESIKNIFSSFNADLYENYDTSTIYNNNLNFVLKYNDTVKAGLEYEISQKKHYIENLGSQLPITNKIYPKYNVETTVEKIKTVKNVYKNVEEIVDTKVENIHTHIDNDDIIEEIALSDGKVKLIKHKLVPVEFEDTVSKDTIKIDDYYNEYAFSKDVPTIDLKEMMLRNINGLNRFNIITLEKTNNGSKIYNSFIGSSYDKDADKSILHISSSDTNINVGTETLMGCKEINKFNKQNKLAIEFDEISLIGKQINSNNPIWNVKTINGIKYYNSTIKIFGNLYERPFSCDTVGYDILVGSNSNNNILTPSNYCFKQVVYDNQSYNTFLCVNNFLNEFIVKDIDSYDNIYIENFVYEENVDNIIGKKQSTYHIVNNKKEYYIPIYGGIRKTRIDDSIINEYNSNINNTYRSRNTFDVTLYEKSNVLFVEIIENNISSTESIFPEHIIFSNSK